MGFKELASDSQSLTHAFKQFSLETEHLELTYQSLQERFKSVQQTLQESHTRHSGKLAELDFLSHYLKTILQHVSQGVLFIDQNGIITTYNASAQAILQIPEKDLLFHSFHDCLEDRLFGFSLKDAFAEIKCPNTMFVSLNHQGLIKELEVEAAFVEMSRQAMPIGQKLPSSHTAQGLLILLRDITKFRRMQQTAHRQDRLKELGGLAAHLAHEIRNPLGGIRGFAAILEQELKDRPDLQQMAAHIVQGSDQLNDFVTQVLQYARPFQLHIENTDLLLLLEEIKQLMQADSAWNTKINFTIHGPTEGCLFPIDPQLMKSALLNLLVNAIQAMPNGGNLTVSVKLDPSLLVIEVEDTGVGISADNLTRLFTPFFTTKEAGNGLGLAEVHKDVQAHQGWVDVESREGRGSKFTIKIPVKPGE